MKIFIKSNLEENKIGGGWTFLRNFLKGLDGKAQIVTDVRQCDIVFIPGVTLVDRQDVDLGHQLGKKIVFRADNVPKKSRNKRGRVLDDMTHYGSISDMVVFQSEWSAEYCMPLFLRYGGSEPANMIIYNGVDENIFFPGNVKNGWPIYLFAFHGKNEVKGMGIAKYLFERFHRENPKSEFWFIYNFKKELEEQIASNYDFWNGEKIKHLNLIDTPEEMAKLMRQCTHLIYPAYADAAPNVVLEARACGLEVVGQLDPTWSGVAEMLDPGLDISLDRMILEYMGLFDLLLNEKELTL